eukprot:COSAG01_NODE_1880_length_8993_cov_60.775916_7_plen_80_part_00
MGAPSSNSYVELQLYYCGTVTRTGLVVSVGTRARNTINAIVRVPMEMDARRLHVLGTDWDFGTFLQSCDFGSSVTRKTC